MNIQFINCYNDIERFSVEFVEFYLLDEELNTKADKGNRIRMAVELDDFGKALAYHLLRGHPGDPKFVSGYARKHTRVPADQMLHVFLPERALQTRGAPMLVTAIGALKMLHSYREAELVVARAAESKMGFITSPDGNGYTGDNLEDTHAPVMSAANY